MIADSIQCKAARRVSARVWLDAGSILDARCARACVNIFGRISSDGVSRFVVQVPWPMAHDAGTMALCAYMVMIW